MIGAVSTNSLISALFGPGAVRSGTPLSSRQVPSTTPTPAENDTVEISGLAREAEAIATRETSNPSATSTASDQAAETKSEEAQVRELKQRDAEVRRHEQAHKASAGSSARGGPTFEYTTGPDGKRYAVGGEVNIDTSPIQGNPQATIAKMQQIRRAALAPSEPSSQDRSVAAKASQLEREARAELNEQHSADPSTPSAGITSSSASTSPRSHSGFKAASPPVDGTGSGRSSRTDRSDHPESEIVGELLDLTV